MPIKIPNNLPAVNILAKENIFVMNETRALSQDIRPLKFVIVYFICTLVILSYAYKNRNRNTAFKTVK